MLCMSLNPWRYTMLRMDPLHDAVHEPESIEVHNAAH